MDLRSLRRLTPIIALAVALLLSGGLRAERLLAASVALSSTIGAPGTTITANGTGWTAGNLLFVSLDTAEGRFFCEPNPIFPDACANGRQLGHTSIGSDGTFSISFAVPPDTDLGTHTLAFIEASSQNPVETEYTSVIANVKVDHPEG